MFGAVAPVRFAFTASLIKAFDGDVSTSSTLLFVHWQTYGLAGCGIASLFLAQNAFHAGLIAASQAALALDGAPMRVSRRVRTRSDDRCEFVGRGRTLDVASGTGVAANRSIPRSPS